MLCVLSYYKQVVHRDTSAQKWKRKTSIVISNYVNVTWLRASVSAVGERRHMRYWAQAGIEEMGPPGP